MSQIGASRSTHATKDPGVRLNLLVLRCQDIELSKRFFGALGCRFVEEKHGTGPTHYSCTMGAVVLELYPTRAESSAGVRLGLCVDDLAVVLERVAQLGAAVESSADTHAVVVDPDGRRVALAASS